MNRLWNPEELRIIFSYNILRRRLSFEQTERLKDIAAETPSEALDQFILKYGFDNCDGPESLERMRELVEEAWARKRSA